MRPQCKLEMKDLAISYDRFFAFACKELSITGNVIALLGHNGAGKSTLMKSFLGLLPSRSGYSAVKTAGEESVLIPERDMAFCPEQGAVFADISVRAYLECWCRLKHGNARYYRSEGQWVIDQLQIEPLLKRLGRELSKGQRRRVQTAVGFLTNPKLFFLDEPFDGLDVWHAAELAALIEREASRRSFVISTHRLDLIERLADAFVVLKEGKVQTAGTLTEVCSNLVPFQTTISSPTLGHVHELLQRRFPEAIFSHLGGELLVSGEGCSVASLEKTLGLEGCPGKVSTGRASLTDALGFSLGKGRTPTPVGPEQAQLS